METLDKAKDILKWSALVNAEPTKFRFDPDFITSVLEKHQKYNEFTDRQASAISNIYERFKVAEYLEKQQ